MAWTEKDLQNLKAKGYKIDDKFVVSSKIEHATKNFNYIESDGIKSKIKIEKVSIEKNTIEFVLISLKQKELITDFVTEHKFDSVRRFRFDWAIIDLKIAIEYEGLFSEKSGHTTVGGFTEDCIKYNLAIANGWRVLRYTALNYKNLETDLLKIINN